MSKWSLFRIKGERARLHRIAGGFDWVDARDLSIAAVKAAEQAPSGSQYLISGHWRSIRQMAEAVTRQVGKRPPRFDAPVWLAQMGVPLMEMLSKLNGHPPIHTKMTINTLNSNQQIDNTKAKKEFDYQPRPFSETIQDTLKWFAEQGYL